MLLRFTKMHGLGNDFMVLDLVSQHAHILPKHAKQWGDRHTGIGFDQLLLVPGDLLWQLELEMQRAIADVGGAEIATGFTQRGTSLFAVALIQCRIEFGACLLEPVDGRVEVLVDFGFLRGRQCSQLVDRHLGDVGGEEGQIAHGRPPHWYARVKLE